MYEKEGMIIVQRDSEAKEVERAEERKGGG